MATQAMSQMREYAHPNLGRLVQPRHFNGLDAMIADRIPWAADNDCFQGLDAPAFCSMLDALQVARIRAAGGERRAELWMDPCLFVCVPDVVGDALATARRFEVWDRAVRRRGLPVALVIQDGLEDLPRWLDRTWHRLDAVFVGGSTEWKLGPVAEAIVRDAKARGLWVHMGRVNSARRVAYAASIGCDSIDGTKFVRWRTRYLGEGLVLAGAPAQLRL